MSGHLSLWWRTESFLAWNYRSNYGVSETTLGASRDGKAKKPRSTRIAIKLNSSDGMVSMVPGSLDLRLIVLQDPTATNIVTLPMIVVIDGKRLICLLQPGLSKLNKRNEKITQGEDCLCDDWDWGRRSYNPRCTATTGKYRKRRRGPRYVILLCILIHGDAPGSWARFCFWDEICLGNDKKVKTLTLSSRDTTRRPHWLLGGLVFKVIFGLSFDKNLKQNASNL